MRLTGWLHRIATAFTRHVRNHRAARDRRDMLNWQPPAREPAWSQSGRHPLSDSPHFPV
jgi:hypothetical protein